MEQSSPALAAHHAGRAPGLPWQARLRGLLPVIVPLAREARSIAAMMLLPVFLLPAVGSAGDIATLAAAAAGFLAAAAAASAFRRDDRRTACAAAALSLALATSLGGGVLLLTLLYLALTGLRPLLPVTAGPLDLLVGGTGLLLALDAAFVALALERSASLLLFGGLMGLFLAAREEHAPAGLGLREIRLALTALLLGSYMALLVADPMLAPHAGPLAGGSVPLLGAALLRASRTRAAGESGHDAVLIACLAGWALVMTAAMEGLPGF